MSKPFDPTEPVQTRAGHPVRILCTDLLGDGPIVAAVSMHNGEALHRYGTDGRFMGDGKDHSLDLINVPNQLRSYRPLLVNESVGTGVTLKLGRHYPDADSARKDAAAFAVSTVGAVVFELVFEKGLLVDARMVQDKQPQASNYTLALIRLIATRLRDESAGNTKITMSDLDTAADMLDAYADLGSHS